MLPLRFQIVGHLIVGFLVGALLSLALRPNQLEVERKAVPFTTRSGMLMVTLTLHRNGLPEIISVQPLDHGRLTVVQPGDYTLSLEDKDGQSLYALPFRAIFLLPGEPPRPVDTIRLIFVVPAGSEVSHILVTGPQGSASYELSQP